MTNGPIEPAAFLREAASFWRQTYIALINEGFTEREAVAILGHIIAAGMSQGGQ